MSTFENLSKKELISLLTSAIEVLNEGNGKTPSDCCLTCLTVFECEYSCDNCDKNTCPNCDYAICGECGHVVGEEVQDDELYEVHKRARDNEKKRIEDEKGVVDNSFEHKTPYDIEKIKQACSNGLHDVLLIGPPNCGKTTLIKDMGCLRVQDCLSNNVQSIIIYEFEQREMDLFRGDGLGVIVESETNREWEFLKSKGFIMVNYDDYLKE